MNSLDVLKLQLAEFKNDYELREDWHEPDEQGVSAIITGDHLDNAFGTHQPDLPNQEFVVHLKAGGRTELKVNLADLLAIATR